MAVRTPNTEKFTLPCSKAISKCKVSSRRVVCYVALFATQHATRDWMVISEEQPKLIRCCLESAVVSAAPTRSINSSTSAAPPTQQRIQDSNGLGYLDVHFPPAFGTLCDKSAAV